MSATAAPKSQKVTREFDIKLTEEDRLKLGDELADLIKEVLGLREEAKSSAALFKTKIDERLDRTETIANAIKSGTETRTLEAEMIKDFAVATKRFFIGTKLIHEEAMTADELQLTLDDVRPKKPAKTARDGRLEDSQKAVASKKRGKAKTADIVKLETNRKSKRSAVDGVYPE